MVVGRVGGGGGGVMCVLRTSLLLASRGAKRAIPTGRRKKSTHASRQHMHVSRRFFPTCVSDSVRGVVFERGRGREREESVWARVWRKKKDATFASSSSSSSSAFGTASAAPVRRADSARGVRAREPVARERLPVPVRLRLSRAVPQASPLPRAPHCTPLPPSQSGDRPILRAPPFFFPSPFQAAPMRRHALLPSSTRLELVCGRGVRGVKLSAPSHTFRQAQCKVYFPIPNGGVINWGSPPPLQNTDT
jgi:hypothetical protein